MRAVFPVIGALIVLPALASLAACGDAFGPDQTLLRTDSLSLAALNGPSRLPSALDVAGNDAPAFPELPAQAGEWDVQFRLQNGAFVVVPNPGSGAYRGAGVTPTTNTIESPGSAPRATSAYTRTAVPITAGQSFYVQSRQYTPLQCGTVGKYGLLKIVSIAADSGVVHVAVRSNQACDDERLQ